VIGVGTILHETYRIEAELGRGGMGCVYAATHTRLPRRVAVKVLTETKEPQALQRFRREAEICSQIGHGNIVEVFDFNQLDGQPYIVMELLTGESLHQRLKREPILPRPLLVQMVREIGKALAAAHAVGVVHRDLKPENVFLCREEGVERFKILDFGISKIMGAMSLQTREDALLGTPGYMAPEQARGDVQQVTASADQFSFGAIVYEALSGHPAFMAPEDTPYTVLYKIVHKDPPPLFDQPPAVRALVSRALAKEPRDRFGDVAEMTAALTAALEEPAPTRPRRSWRRSWPALTIGLGVAGLGAALIALPLWRARFVATSSVPAPPPTPSAKPPLIVPQPQPHLPPSVSEPPAPPTVPHDAGAPPRPPKQHPTKHHAPKPGTEDELSNPYEAKS
jgi:serine/threonine-protein kinase